MLHIRNKTAEKYTLPLNNLRSLAIMALYSIREKVVKVFIIGLGKIWLWLKDVICSEVSGIYLTIFQLYRHIYVGIGKLSWLI